MGRENIRPCRDRGLCAFLTEEQIELLALGRGLSAKEQMYANYHVRECPSCEEQLRVTKQFFAKLHALGGLGA